MLDVILVFGVTLLGTWWWISSRQSSKNMPPSPAIALPFIGHLYLMKSDPMDQILAWRKQLGDLFTLQFGSEKIVMINKYEHLHEALVKNHEVFIDRHDNFATKMMLQNKGVFSLKGGEWKEQRAFMHSTLRDLGMGKNVMASRIQEETRNFLQVLEETKGEPTDLKNLISIMICNNICGVVFGKRFSYTDKTLLEMLEILQLTFSLVGASSVVNVFPFLMYLPGDFFRFKELLRINQRMKSLLWELVNKDGRKVNVHDEASEDLVSAYLTEIERKKAAGITNTSIDEDNLLASVWNLFNAGTETTSKTIQFVVLFMVNFPDIQEKLFQEIKENVGTDRLPDMSDKTKLKFLNAYTWESLRYSGLGPLAPDRVALQDVTLGGYHIPKGTAIMPVYDSLMWDEEVWGDPKTFRPERFLGKVKKEFTPFSIGKRNCVGEGMAVMELFLCLAAMVQRFRFLPEDPDKKPSMVPIYGFTRSPQPFKVRCIPRTS